MSVSDEDIFNHNNSIRMTFSEMNLLFWFNFHQIWIIDNSEWFYSALTLIKKLLEDKNSQNIAYVSIFRLYRVKYRFFTETGSKISQNYYHQIQEQEK